MDVNKKLMKQSTSDQGQKNYAYDHLNFDPENKLYYHKWEVPANTLGTMSTPYLKVDPQDREPIGDPGLVVKPKIMRPLSALSVKKNHYNMQRPKSASSFVLTLHNFKPSIVVENIEKPPVTQPQKVQPVPRPQTAKS